MSTRLPQLGGTLVVRLRFVHAARSVGHPRVILSPFIPYIELITSKLAYQKQWDRSLQLNVSTVRLSLLQILLWLFGELLAFLCGET